MRTSLAAAKGACMTAIFVTNGQFFNNSLTINGDNNSEKLKFYFTCYWPLKDWSSTQSKLADIHCLNSLKIYIRFIFYSSISPELLKMHFLINLCDKKKKSQFHEKAKRMQTYLSHGFRLLPLFPRSEVGHVDSMMECLLRPDQYLITAIDPAWWQPVYSRGRAWGGWWSYTEPTWDSATSVSFSLRSLFASKANYTDKMKFQNDIIKKKKIFLHFIEM